MGVIFYMHSTAHLFVIICIILVIFHSNIMIVTGVVFNMHNAAVLFVTWVIKKYQSYF